MAQTRIVAEGVRRNRFSVYFAGTGNRLRLDVEYPEKEEHQKDSKILS